MENPQILNHMQFQFRFTVHDADAKAVKKKMSEKNQKKEKTKQKQEQDVISGVQMPGGWTVTASGTNREAIAEDGQNADLLPSRPSSLQCQCVQCGCCQFLMMMWLMFFSCYGI